MNNGKRLKNILWKGPYMTQLPHISNLWWQFLGKPHIGVNWFASNNQEVHMKPLFFMLAGNGWPMKTVKAKLIFSMMQMHEKRQTLLLDIKYVYKSLL